MGIKNLMVIIKKFAPESISNKNINDYKNKILAIDANLLIYKMIFAIRKNGYDIQNDNIIVTHIHSLLLKLKSFIKHNITPVFVFDGMPPKIKDDVIKKRDTFHKLMEQKYYKAVTQDEKKKYYFAKSKITFKEMMDCKNLINIFGFEIIDAVEEADSELALLSKLNKIDYIVTDDLDILIFGGKNMLKNFSVQDKKIIQEINSNILLKQLGLTQSQLIDLGILLGCDYCPVTKGIGTIGAYKLIKEYGSIDNIDKNRLKLPYDYKIAQNYFINPISNNSYNGNDNDYDYKKHLEKIKKIQIKKFNKKNIDMDKLKIFLKKNKFKDDYFKDLVSKIN